MAASASGSALSLSAARTAAAAVWWRTSCRMLARTRTPRHKRCTHTAARRATPWRGISIWRYTSARRKTFVNPTCASMRSSQLPLSASPPLPF
eukprot:5789698-Pleurochrysis_carterae.AAC.1